MPEVDSRFSFAPGSADLKRSRFDRPQSIKLTGNVGELIPFYVDEVLPHDTHSIKTSKVVRMSTPIVPFMDNIFLDTFYFYVPYRLVWDDWKKFFGEQISSIYQVNSNPRVPQLVVNTSVPDALTPMLKSTADYMGVPPIKVSGHDDLFGTPSKVALGLSVSALPFRALALIWNEFFRDENLQDPVMVHTDSVDRIFADSKTSFVDSVELGGKCPPVGKFHDFFTSCTPSPQFGDAVQIAPTSISPVRTFGSPLVSDQHQKVGMQMLKANGSGSLQTVLTSSNGNLVLGSPTAPDHSPVFPVNLGIQGISVDINDLRYSIALQHLFERDMRQGHRYFELLQSHFGVRPADATLQRPEFLGGNRIPISVNQVVQTAPGASSTVTPLGDTGAFSHTVDDHGDFSKSFDEAGVIIGLAAVRYSHSYQQGLERFWSRKERFDFYWPEFANLGEQPVKKSEIFWDGAVVSSGGNYTSHNNETFGFQEYAADYRYKPNRVAGDMRSISPESLDAWHFSDDYANCPTLSDNWIREDPSNVDRALYADHKTADQFFMDVLVDNSTTRQMPMYSVPGLERI